MVSLAASYGFLPWFRAGLEVAGEDLEGFGDDEEVEGGAKLLFGPTMSFAMPLGFFAKVNTSAAYTRVPQSLRNAPTAHPTWGFMGRAVLGWGWH